jgi:hypothetical protein
MPATGTNSLARRDFLSLAVVAGGALALPGGAFAQVTAPVYDNAVQRLLMLSSQSAFARLTMVDGFWNSRVARFGLPVLFKKTPANAAGPLGQDVFREQLQRRLNNLAESGARGAAPLVSELARKLVVPDPAAILRGPASAAASLLRIEAGSGLVNAMLPALEQTLLAAQDPIVAQAVTALAGVALRDVAHAVALAADNGIWYEIGKAEADIRANPALANDPGLAAALRPMPTYPAPAAPSPTP